MKVSDAELISLGLQVQEWRKRGGVSVLKKYGSKHFSELGKISAAKKIKLKNIDRT